MVWQLISLLLRHVGTIKYTVGRSPVDMAFYARSDPGDFDVYSYVSSSWREDENVLHDDFEIYSTFADLRARQRAWQAVAYNSDGVDRGFPGLTQFPHDHRVHPATFHGAAANTEPDAAIWIELLDSNFIDSDQGWSSMALGLQVYLGFLFTTNLYLWNPKGV